MEEYSCPDLSFTDHLVKHLEGQQWEVGQSSSLKEQGVGTNLASTWDSP